MPSTAIDFHRLTIHFAIALLLFAPVLQVLAVWTSKEAMQVAARACLLGGATAAVVAALTGFLASSEFRHPSLEAHELLGFITAGCAALIVGVWTWKPVAEPRSRGGMLVLAGLCVAAGLAGGTGYLGGHMAHGHGAHGPLVGGSSAGRDVAAAPGGLPADLEAAHARFAEKCSLCHSAEKALEANVPAEEWPALVRVMAERAEGEISTEDQAMIVRFLRFHSAGRAGAEARGAAR